MIYISCTRFNNETWLENAQYRSSNGIRGAIYGSEFRINEKYPQGCLIFVVEMNLNTNLIQGIGLIRNSLVLDKKHNIYSRANYNKYIYKGNYWISRETILALESSVVEIFDNMLFRGLTHLKRLAGITVLREKSFANWNLISNNVLQLLKNLFTSHFRTVSQTIMFSDIPEDEDEFELVVPLVEQKSSKKRTIRRTKA